ncbi:MAG: arsenate reductase (glutaredoxin) [Gammaproteobacteria bacterium]|nr:arsenate reductase (glutaredoxin) [Gammaproteobacteria bacterium]
MKVTIYHNPRCSKSRQTLQLIQNSNIKPTIIEYLKTPPSYSELTQILKLLNISPKALLRQKEPEYKTLGLDNSALSDEDILTAMIANPSLIERPIVIQNNKAIIGRPPEKVLEILNV